MAAAGHDVHLITAHNETEKKIIEIEGFKVYYLPINYDQKFNKWQRIKSFLKFTFASYKTAASIPNADLVFATSTPVTIGFTALMLKYFRKLPYIFEVRDLWPEVPVEMGIIKNRFLIYLLKKFVKTVYKNANKIIALSPGMVDVIKAYNLKTKLHLITNFTEQSLFSEKENKPHLLRQKYLTQNERGIIYFGHLGKANHLEYFIDAAEKCMKTGIKNLKFFIVGDGSEKEKLYKCAANKKLNNLVFLEPLPKEKLAGLLSIMDFSYISFLNLPILFTSSPNKLFDSLASSNLCITNTKGWMQDLLEKNKCGLCIDPLKPESFCDKILPFLNDEFLLKTYQQNAKLLSQKEFTADVATTKLIKILNETESEIKLKQSR